MQNLENIAARILLLLDLETPNILHCFALITELINAEVCICSLAKCIGSNLEAVKMAHL